MSDILDPIKKHDITTIQHRTKISQYNIQALFERDFSKMRKVQFLGFVSILEREFNIDLASYREEFFTSQGVELSQTPEIELFVSKEEPVSKGKQGKIIFILLGLIGLVFFAYIYFAPSEEKKSQPLNNSVILKANRELNRIKKEEALKEEIETNATIVKEEEIKTIEKVMVPKVTILPKRRVWMGMIPMAGGKRVQKIIKSAYELNTSKSWLIVFGHGHIDIEYNKELLEFSSRKKLWFLYEDEQLSQINKEQFKEYNGGKSW